MNKHTPGPWVVYDDSNDGKTNRIEIAARGKTVAWIYHSVPAEDLPNARLIAAAPDLLDALKNIVNLWDHHASAHGDGTIFPLHVAARAAIAKAEGKA
jgi:hypothetical protein